MSENVLETVRATVQDFLAPKMRTHGVKLDSLDKRLEDTNKSLEQRFEDSRSSLQLQISDMKSSLQHQITDTKETLRAEMRTLQSRFEILEVRFGSLEELFERRCGRTSRMARCGSGWLCWKRGCRSGSALVKRVEREAEDRTNVKSSFVQATLYLDI